MRPELCAVVELVDQAVATSGNSENYLNYRGRRAGHLRNPRTGEPVETYLSTSAVAPTALEADAASTTLFVGGRNGDKTLVEMHVSWLPGSRDAEGQLMLEASPGFPTWRPI